MAFTTTAVASQSGTAFNVDFAVGSGAPNLKDDVMLVQALMRIFYWELAAGLNGGRSPPAGEKQPIAVDGFAGPSTRKHIIKWQQDLLSANAKVLFDGRLDPFRTPVPLSTISKTVYALALLDLNCRGFCEDNGFNNYSNLPNRQDVPPLLRAALKTVKTTAAAYEKSFA